MPNRKKRARRRQGGAGVILPVLIVIFAMAALSMAIVLIYSNPLAPEEKENPPYNYGELNFEELGDATVAPLVLGVTATPESTQEAPEETPEPDSVSDADVSENEGDTVEIAAESDNRLVPTPMPGDYFLPIYDKALRTPDDLPMIAITVDGCDNADVLTQILNLASLYSAKMTLFPSGDALMKLGSGFRTCVSQMGFEVENCSYDASKRDYTLSSAEMALQIWRQGIAASYAMSRDYEQHFYRPSNKQSAYDQRTHFFIRKLGLKGIASYTHSYKDFNKIDSLVATLENGKIYQFDMTEKSMEMLEIFIGEASRKGYKLVTMNELFGLEDNTIGKRLTIDQQILPDMNDYTPTYYDLKLNYRTNAVFALQGKLISLGYLKSSEEGKDVRADGIYGSDTSIAVSAFQAKVGIVATGNADVETQQKLFADDSPPAQ